MLSRMYKCMFQIIEVLNVLKCSIYNRASLKEVLFK